MGDLVRGNFQDQQSVAPAEFRNAVETSLRHWNARGRAVVSLRRRLNVGTEAPKATRS